MKIVESTEERLVIRREELTSAFELVCLALGVNVLVTICFVAISENLSLSNDESFAISFAIGWLLVHLLFPGNKRNLGYLFTVTFASIPLLGVALLSLTAIGLLQFPQIASLTFDKSRKLLTIKYSKILLWYPSVQYPLNQIVEATLASKQIFIGATAGVAYVQVVQLARRRQDGKIVRKDILAGVKQDTVYQINKFLSRPLK
ncbi:hypothetical protein [Nostoc sp. UHCC 0252]|uniref:hypothetical protein n=1 Tax=Nostoc sp. UHCC 0252 TaxID=3110241 RepID=UPI002B21B41F|nr:hypothetical protein [Nostoc sp. UHCC 0252]MEA5605517.1 hypothetical protein [Nostoc sp. UHCC 0252]